MPKPRFLDLYEIVLAQLDKPTGAETAALRIESMIDAWEAEDDAERERGRKALEIMSRWGRPPHGGECVHWGDKGECDCGLAEAIASLVEVPSSEQRAASWEDVTASSEDEDMEQWNQRQTDRRDAFLRGAIYYVGTFTDEAALVDARRAAACRYPLKKRVPATKPDPHKVGRMWRLHKRRLEWSDPDVDGGAWGLSGRCGVYVGVTPERVRVLAELLDNPYTIEESTEIESEETP